MNLTRDRQGFIENVHDMTLPQLTELLERQENILSKKKFIASLPDKGKKSQQFAETLRNLIAARSGGNIRSNSASSNLSKKITPRVLSEHSEEMTDVDKMTIETFVTRNESDVTYSSEANATSAAEDLSQQMQELSVGTQNITDTQQSAPPNSYERVIKKVEESPLSDKTKFLPHRSKKDRNSSNNSTAVKPKSPKVPEESAVYPPSYSHESTKLISIEESVQLIQEQKVKAEQIAAERAAQRLAEHFSTKMDTYQPPTVDMRYRDDKLDDDDSDEDDVDDNKNDIDSDDIPSDEDDNEEGL